MTDKTSSTKKNVSGQKSNALGKTGRQGVQPKSGSTPSAAGEAGGSTGKGTSQAQQAVGKTTQPKSGSTPSAPGKAGGSAGKGTSQAQQAVGKISQSKSGSTLSAAGQAGSSAGKAGGSALKAARSTGQTSKIGSLLRTAMTSKYALPALAGGIVAAVALPVVIIIYLNNPLSLRIKVDTVFATMHSNRFSIQGLAVNRGYICRSGIVDEVDFEADMAALAGAVSNSFDVDKHFICDDGTGSFDINLTGSVNDLTMETTGTWVVTGGTGRYEKLAGSGTLKGTNGDGTHILDTYDGRVGLKRGD